MKKWLFICLCLYLMFTGSAIASFGRPNLALSGSVISSSPAIQGSAANINDGLLSTLLYSYTQKNSQYYCEFVLDLTKSYSIDQIDLYISQTRGFNIYVSEDNQTWGEPVKTREWDGSVGTALSIPFDSPVTGRYIKYYGWATWNQYVGVVEIAVYEQGSVPVSSPPGTLGTDNIAANKQIVQNVSGSQPNNPPANLLDADTATSWIPAGTSVDDENGKSGYFGAVVIDLGKEVNIGKVVLKTNAYHSNVISFPVQGSDLWGEKWMFSSIPDYFATNNSGSGEIIFNINGLVKSRYLSIQTQRIQVTDTIRPEISELEVYEWAAGTCADSDGDGVSDQVDQCPQTPADSPVYSNGCPSIKGDFNNNKKLDLADCIGILQSLTH